MNPLPDFVEVDDFPGADFSERWKCYLDELYRLYLESVAHGALTFRGLRVSCQYRPETYGRHYAFWHMMQEGLIEDDRNIDLQRCRRIRWISWVIREADSDDRIRVFPQLRKNNDSWVLWLHEEHYAVILAPRKNHYLLKTAFVVKPHKANEFLRLWKLHSIKG